MLIPCDITTNPFAVSSTEGYVIKGVQFVWQYVCMLIIVSLNSANNIDPLFLWIISNPVFKNDHLASDLLTLDNNESKNNSIIPFQLNEKRIW